MVTIQVEVNPATVQKIGMEALRKQLLRTIELEELAMLAMEIDRKMKEAGLDYKALTEKARQEAWDEFKAAHPEKFLA